MHIRLNLLNKQHGQSSVFVLVMLSVIVISAIFLYQSGRLTTEKMQLQNGADAAAYTASALESRAMNFSAYTNRAMVANEVAIGQVVGLLSLASEFKSVKKFFNIYATTIAAIGTATIVGAAPANIIATFLRSVGTGFGVVGKGLEVVAKPLASIVTNICHYTNKVYSFVQYSYYIATLQFVQDSLKKSLYGNVVANSGASKEELAKINSLSMALIYGHFATYMSGYTKRFKQQKSKSKIKSRAKVKDDANAAGMGRLAATVRDARDSFSDGKGKDSRSWEFSLHPNINLLLVQLGFKIGVESKGGSELVQTSKGSKEQAFVWSGADAAVFIAYIKVVILGLPIKVGLPKIPIGAGGYQVGTKDNMLSGKNLAGAGKPTSPPAYGGAPSYKLPWPLSKEDVKSNKVKAKYSGLSPYLDVAIASDEKKDKGFQNLVKRLPFSFPFFLVAVEKDYDKYKSQGPQFKNEFNLGVGSKEFGNKIAAVAKSEVYYHRPVDVSYFARKDKHKEKGNLFSPFWQPRLVPTSDLDRVFILALQQKKIWISGKDLKSVPIIKADVLAAKIESFLRRILP